MKEQTFITFIKDANDKKLTFERWSYKRPETVLNKCKQLYKEMFTRRWFANDMKDAKTFVICSGSEYPYNEVLRISIDELLV